MDKEKIKFHVGTSGWSYLHWRARFYPINLNNYKWLEYYAKHFNTTEVNMTFYRWPKENMLKNWYKRTPSHFSFTLKAPKIITHIKKLTGIKKIVRDFYTLADLLKEKLACILFQLPPSLKFNKDKLQHFLNTLDKNYNNVIEFRHPSWWQEDTYNLLMNHKIIFCVVSASQLPQDIIITSNVCYFRFHGLESVSYTHLTLPTKA